MMSANLAFCGAGSAVIVENAHFARAFVWLPDRLIHRIGRKLGSCEADEMNRLAFPTVDKPLLLCKMLWVQ
jgi:hypothetical protein